MDAEKKGEFPQQPAQFSQLCTLHCYLALTAAVITTITANTITIIAVITAAIVTITELQLRPGVNLEVIEMGCWSTFALL